MVLKLRVEAPDGWRDAKCRSMALTGDDPWFDDEAVAKEFCNAPVTCPIRHECGLFALVNNCKEGVWGGMSEVTRKAIRKKWPLKSGRVPRPEWRFFTEEEANWYDPAILRAELDGEDDDDDDDE